jgi:hypothetical protein
MIWRKLSQIGLESRERSDRKIFICAFWDVASNSIMGDKDVSENPAFQDYIQEHIQKFKWWDSNGEKMSDEKGKTLAIAGGHSNIPSASTMKISSCIQHGGPDDATFEHAKAPPPPPSRVGGNISFPSSSRASGSDWLMWGLLCELRGQGVPRHWYPRQKQHYRNDKYVIVRQPAHRHIDSMKRIRHDVAKRRGPQNANHDVRNQPAKMTMTKTT